ncbi:MAG: DUF447 family protein [Candidatus Methylarchaceae archaeon HK02M2]|nr:DUF447 family protein [Candidatus Methylarchaceae archaeon HK02M2]
MSTKNILSDLGFIKNCLFEAIISTYGSDCMPNAAPMGVMTDDMRQLIIKPYTKSQTFKNILLRKCAVVNLSANPIVYYETAFKDVNLDNKFSSEWFEKSDLIDAPKLKKYVDICIEVNIIGAEDIEKDRARFLCKIEKIDSIRSAYPRVYCRAPFALIESIIHATRIEVFLSNKEKKRAEELINLVKLYEALIRRVAPDTAYVKIMAEILLRIEAWKIKYNCL